MDSIFEGLPNVVKHKVGRFVSAKEVWGKMKSIYMVREDQEENPSKKEVASNKLNEGQPNHAIWELYKYFSFSISDYENDPFSLPNMSNSKILEEAESVKEPPQNEEEVIAKVNWERELICAL